MILKILRWLLGYVEFEARGRFPERLINITISRGISLWDLTAENKRISGKISIAEYKKIRPFARKAKVRAKIIKKSGMPIFVKKHHNRAGFLIGTVCFFAIIALLGNHIWAININGIENLSYSEMMSALSKNGLTVGTRITDIEVSELERNLQLNIDELRWVSVNLEGSVANVEVKEKTVVPETKTDNSLSQIVAKKDGVIHKTTVYSGKAVVLPGYAVTKGQVLVSGDIENLMGEITRVKSEAVILAKTYQIITFEQPLKVNLKLPTGIEKSRSSAQILAFSFPLNPAFLSEGEYEKEYKKSMLKTENAVLPVGIIEEKNIEYKNKIVKFSEEEAKVAIEKKIAVYEAMEIPYAEVVERKMSYIKESGKLICEVQYTMIEEISREEKLPPLPIEPTTEAEE